ncbi:MAG: DUF4912 domain-containing protein [Rhizonema sp. NSF051]|nr:DUF4912 domain-containing protein [Rhizonema sp. NSF051]
MFSSKNSSGKTFVQIAVVVLGLTATPKLLISLPSTLLEPVLAQSQTPSPIPLPTSLPSGTTVKVDGSSSMKVINEALSKQFEQKYAGTKVDLASNGTDKALAAIQRGDINIAAVGRPLTNQEKAKGLVATPVSREKIAIIVGSDNPFQKNLTFEQFSKMFRGEITDWSQIGGAPGKIRFIDHPDYSDTRQSLSTYDIFNKAPFKTGANATRLTEDDTVAIVRELGKDGISYAIADQVINLPSVRVIPMHKTMPNDPRYPYSQPRSYVYRQEAAKPGILAFLGFATSASGQEIVAAAKQQEAEAVRQSVATPPSAATAPVATTPPSLATSPAATSISTPTTEAAPAVNSSATTKDKGGFPWWLLLLAGIPLLGLLWWLLSRQDRTAAEDSRTPKTPSPSTTGAGTLEPVTSGNTVIPPAGTGMMTPLVTEEINTSSVTPERPNVMPETQIGANIPVQDTSVAPKTPNVIATETQIGANTPVQDTPVAPIHDSTPLTEVTPAIGIAGLAAGAIAGGAALAGRHKSHITLELRNSTEGYAQWEAPQAHREAAKQQGGRQFQLRIYDATGIDIESQPAHSTQSYNCDESSEDLLVLIPKRDRDYIAEIGYVTTWNHWLILATSNSVRVPSTSESIARMTEDVPVSDTDIPTTAIGAAAITENPVLENIGNMEGRHGSRITLVPHHNREADAVWEISPADREAYQQGGQKFQLRIYDVTSIDFNTQPAHNMQSYDCDELSQELRVPIYRSDRDYVAEIGYATPDAEWLTLARSNPVRVSSTLQTEGTSVVDTPFSIDTEPNTTTTDISTPTTAMAIAGMTGAVAGGTSFSSRLQGSHIRLVPNSFGEADALWEVPQADRETALQQGGQHFQLRIYDVTDIDLDTQPAHNVQFYDDCDEFSQQRHVPIYVSDRDYVAEIGYVTAGGEWLTLARSNSMWALSMSKTQENTVALDTSYLPESEPNVLGSATFINPEISDGLHESRIALVPRHAGEANAVWEVLLAEREKALQQGGQHFQLRIYDVTDIDLDRQPAHDVQFYDDCDEFSQERHVPIYRSDRDYVAEIGYLTSDNQWLILARSKPLRVPTFAAESRLTKRDGCKIQHLAVHSRNHCYRLDDAQMRSLQETAVSKTLEPGIHVVRIKDGNFAYGMESQMRQPIVLLWIYGGRFINKKTNASVQATWSTLNGYDDTLTLEVSETTTLCAFFLDTYVDDNHGELTLSVIRLYSNVSGNP